VALQSKESRENGAGDLGDDSSDAAEVLIVGAGPTGLVLALWLVRQGVRIRLIDAEAEPGTTSRALAVQARTLELYRSLDLAETVVEQGHKVAAVQMWVGGQSVAQFPLGAIGQGASPYSFALIYPQDEHERLLIERLAALGVQVERSVRLLDFEERGDGVVARLCDAAGAIRRMRARYVAGCDGARSQVRQVLKVDFSGGTYDHLFYVADAQASGAVSDGNIHVALDDADFVIVFGLASPHRVRLIGTVDARGAARGDQLGWDDVRSAAFAHLDLEVSEISWFSTYHVHHRVAEHFRRGRAFLVGDAAHIHSPVGGQGMNTGIGDAVNLAWKLAAVLKQGAAPGLLESYEEERIAFARRLVNTTDRVFQFVSNRGALAKQVRTRIAPHVIAALLERPMVRRLAFRTVSQIGIAYRSSRLSQGRAGKVHAGDRMPWVPGANGDLGNFAPLGSRAWQVHVYGQASPTLIDACAARDLPLQVFAWDARAEAAGLARDAAYVIRPDTYVGCADPGAEGTRLLRYLDEVNAIGR
jgi:2-polyprenyl-6-methoxyphenol hydroxylase-like FAD-dependent oxidoreductase